MEGNTAHWPGGGCTMYNVHTYCDFSVRFVLKESVGWETHVDNHPKWCDGAQFVGQ